MATIGGFFTFKQPFARERITVDNTVKSLTATTYNDAAANVDVRRRASGARITVEAQPVRFTEEGTSPSNAGGSEVGTLAAATDVIYLEGYNAVSRFKAIRSGGTDAVIEVVYFR